MKERRLRINYLRAAAPTARYCALVFVIAAAIFCGILLYASSLLNDVATAMATSPDHPLSLYIQSRLISMAMLVGGGFLTFLMTILIVLLVIGERIGGPTIAIRAVIADFKQGKYETPRKLRPTDELQTIMDDLIDLGKTLRERGGRS